MRHLLGFSSLFSEAIIVPLVYGVIPLVVRIQGGMKALSYSYNAGITMGTMFAISTLVIGLAALVSKNTKKIRPSLFYINLAFILTSVVIIVSTGIRGYATNTEGVFMMIIWLVYIATLAFVRRSHYNFYGKKSTFF